MTTLGAAPEYELSVAISGGRRRDWLHNNGGMEFLPLKDPGSVDA